MSEGSDGSHPGVEDQEGVRLLVRCLCGETWGPHKGATYPGSRFGEDPLCPYCGRDWRDLPGAEEYLDEDRQPDFERADWKRYTLPNGVFQGDPSDYDYPEDY